MQRANQTTPEKTLFAKADRIRKRSEFSYLATCGRKIHGPYFLAVYTAGRTERIRLGISVSKKVGRAVSRNRLKRLIREYFRLHRHNIVGFWDIHIIAKKGAAGQSGQEVFSELETIFAGISKKG